MLKIDFRVLLLVAAVVACDPGGADPPPRRAVDTGWDTAFVVGGGIQDSLLFIPRLLAARGDRIYVYDYGDSRIKAFSLAGDLLWTWGGAGAGPTEFGNPLDIEAGPYGGVWVVDGGNGRLVRLTPDGELSGSAPLRGLFIRDILPLRGATLGTPVDAEGTLWVVLDDDGRIGSHGPLPTELQTAHVARLQTAAGVGSDGSTWAVIYPFGNVLLVLRGEHLRCSGTLVEGAPMGPEPPDPPPGALISGVSVMLTDSSVMVLARGRSEAELRILDEYGLDDCEYRRTLRLPNRMLTAATVHGLFVFTYETPAPALIGLRRRTR